MSEPIVGRQRTDGGPVWIAYAANDTVDVYGGSGGVALCVRPASGENRGAIVLKMTAEQAADLAEALIAAAAAGAEPDDRVAITPL